MSRTFECLKDEQPSGLSHPRVRVVHGDITELAVDGFVYYASPDLRLGSGLGGMIAKRGGGGIQRELQALAPVNVGEAVLTGAGKLRSTFIIHAVGPTFHEEALDEKLKKTLESALSLAEDMKARTLAFPPMGTGFYGVPVEVSASIMAASFKELIRRAEHLEELIVCVGDAWQVPPFEAALSTCLEEQPR